MQYVIDNLLLSCVNTQQGKTAPNRPLLWYCSHCGGRRQTAHLPHCSHMQGQAQKLVLLCYLVTVIAGQLY